MSKITKTNFLKGCLLLSNEIKAKEEEKVELKKQIQNTKMTYNSQVKKFNELTKEMISQESYAENIKNKIAKLKKKQYIFLSSLNKKSMLHLRDITQNEKNFDVVNKMFALIFFPLENIDSKRIFIIKNEDELKSILIYCEKIYKGLSKVDMIFYNEIYEQLAKEDLISTFPFDGIYEYIGNIFKIIEQEEALLKLKTSSDDIFSKKNANFLKLKSLENEILKKETKFRSVSKFVKAIGNVYEQIQTNENLKNEKELTELLNRVLNFKKEENNCLILDNMSSLSIQSEYSYSEITSTKSTDRLGTFTLERASRANNALSMNHKLPKNIKISHAEKEEKNKNDFTEENSDFQLNIIDPEIKDSICDEMITKDIYRKEYETNDYVKRTTMKNNKFILGRKDVPDKLKIEKSIDSSNCCAACT